jgi:hypothetical protein
VVSGQGAPPAGTIRFIAADEMSAVLNQRPRRAAVNATGIRSVLDEIETHLGYSVPGNVSFPADVDYFSLDHPKTKAKSVGEVIRTTLAGSGSNMMAGWGPPMSTPTMEWRADFFDDHYYTPTTDNYYFDAGAVKLFYPWLCEYQDVGFQWADFNARIEVEGFDNAGTEPYGWAQLYNATQRARAGNRTVNLTSYINNAAECETAARRLIAYQCQADYVKLNQFMVPIERTYREIVKDAITNPGDEIGKLAAAMPGDQLTTRNLGDGTHNFGDNDTDGHQDWPATIPEGSDMYDTLESLWYPTLTYNADTMVPEQWVIRTITRQWDPNGGWFVTYGVDPHTRVGAVHGSDVSSFGDGTY